MKPAKKRIKAGRHIRRRGEKSRRQTTIRAELLLKICVLVSVPMMILGASTAYLGYHNTTSMLKQSMQELAKTASQEVGAKLSGIENVAIDTGCVARLSDPETTVAQKKAIVDQRATSHGFQRGNILDTNGRSIIDGKDFSDREYFQQALKGEAWISEPLVSKQTGEMSIPIAAPIWSNGVVGTTVVGVVYFIPPETLLNDIVGEIKISPNAGAYMLDKDGYTIAHREVERVENRENRIEQSKTDSTLAQLAKYETAMTKGESGFGRYRHQGESKFLSYAPISGTDGWSISINAPIMDFMSATYRSIIITIILCLLSIGAAIVIATRVAARIGDPVAQCTARLELLAQGDLTTPAPEISSRNETGRLATATMSITQTVTDIIGDIGYCLNEIANGNFRVKSTNTEMYRGDFAVLHQNIESLIAHQSDIMRRIELSADHVASGSDQVSAGAQALSQGATEQASAVEELAASISSISGQVTETAEHAGNASEKVGQVGVLMDQCDNQMKQMVAAMDEISDNSKQISRIIKTIEDIAFQTNILSLNAAVEAARAGEAGKGFAVVADEVRNLAGKSAAAAKDTSELIEAAVQSVGNGAVIAENTAATLSSVSENARETAEMVEKIADAAQQEAESIMQISTGIDQISIVVQTNSATSQESAASSEEMSAQAQMLKELVSRFKLPE